MFPDKQQLPLPKQMSATPEVPTAYNDALQTTMTPFNKAKYGLGGYTPPEVTHEPGEVQHFAPSGSEVKVPRLQPLQFGA
jgi:hypothetical protein